VLLQGVQGITDLITTPGLINTDFADVKMVMHNAGTALMGVATASGEGRAVNAARGAISSPLLEASIEGARGILLNISGGSDLGLFEVNEAAEIIHGVAHADANIIFGAVIDDAMGDEVRVTVIAAGFDRWEEGRERGGRGAAAGCFTGRAEGDLCIKHDDRAAVEARRRALTPLPWAWLRQVHGIRVVVVDRPGAGAGEEGDAAVTAAPGAALAVLTADCAPVALAADNGVVAVAHAGWRGLVAGVLARTVEEMGRLGAGRVEAALGPCIGAECYEFGAGDLDRVAAVVGDEVRATTREGRPALDLPAGVERALAALDVPLDRTAAACTRCSPAHFSHRGGDLGRQALVLWRAPVHDR
jgi:YfiH family protein